MAQLAELTEETAVVEKRSIQSSVSSTGTIISDKTRSITATRDEQLQGEVIFISPTPTQGSNVTYQVKVKINSPIDRLRLGMNAKLNIILRETADVLTVPYDAVQQDENGNDVVYVVTRTESGGITKAAVPVTVGVEGDYYVEVTGDIQEGMEVSMPSDMKFDFSQMMAMGS